MIDVLMAVRHWPDVARRAVASIRRFSDSKIIMVDDASPADQSVQGYMLIARDFDNLALYHLPEHRQHGFALDFALKQTEAPWVITCDHDMIINSERAFSVLLEQAVRDVGAVGKFHNNATTAMLGPYVHPSWALWNADAIRKHNLSFAGFGIKGGWDFATAQFTCYRLEGLGSGSGDKGTAIRSFRIVPVNLGKTVTHAQVWQERGDTWRERVKLEEDENSRI